MKEKKLRKIISKTNPGLTEFELNDLVRELISTYPNKGNETCQVPRDLLIQTLEAVEKLKDTYERMAPQEVEDVLLINELGTLRYHISEILNQY